ncbi:hypothetical protein JNM87_00455 [Candidatus Saccharibacteria bacterium]|nr:hypothetical protein [Candidatus Saccharibacteria bacterium]
MKSKRVALRTTLTVASLITVFVSSTSTTYAGSSWSAHYTCSFGSGYSASVQVQKTTSTSGASRRVTGVSFYTIPSSARVSYMYLKETPQPNPSGPAYGDAWWTWGAAQSITKTDLTQFWWQPKASTIYGRVVLETTPSTTGNVSRSCAVNVPI